MNHWIFVINDDEFVFNKRLKSKTWPIFLKTKNKACLEIGDKIIFYQAGNEGQKFLGTAILDSKTKLIPDKIDAFVNIDRIDIWKKHLSIRDIMYNLSFIKNRDYWGLYFQGGVLKLNENDYSVIIEAAKKQRG